MKGTLLLLIVTCLLDAFIYGAADDLVFVTDNLDGAIYMAVVDPDLLLTDQNFTRLPTRPTSPNALAFDPNEGRVYWWSKSQAKVYSSSLESTDTLRIRSNIRTRDMVFDPITRYLYMIRSKQGSIARMNSHGGGYDRIYRTLDPLYSFDADFRNEILYWTEGTSIRASPMVEGEDTSVSLYEGDVPLNSISVYWNDVRNVTELYAADSNGTLSVHTLRETLAISETRFLRNLTYLEGQFSLHVYRNVVYWTDRSGIGALDIESGEEIAFESDLLGLGGFFRLSSAYGITTVGTVETEDFCLSSPCGALTYCVNVEGGYQCVPIVRAPFPFLDPTEGPTTAITTDVIDSTTIRTTPASSDASTSSSTPNTDTRTDVKQAVTMVTSTPPTAPSTHSSHVSTDVIDSTTAPTTPVSSGVSTSSSAPNTDTRTDVTRPVTMVTSTPPAAQSTHSNHFSTDVMDSTTAPTTPASSDGLTSSSTPNTDTGTDVTQPVTMVTSTPPAAQSTYSNHVSTDVIDSTTIPTTPASSGATPSSSTPNTDMRTDVTRPVTMVTSTPPAAPSTYSNHVSTDVIDSTTAPTTPASSGVTTSSSTPNTDARTDVTEHETVASSTLAPSTISNSTRNTDHNMTDVTGRQISNSPSTGTTAIPPFFTQPLMPMFSNTQADSPTYFGTQSTAGAPLLTVTPNVVHASTHRTTQSPRTSPPLTTNGAAIDTRQQVSANRRIIGLGIGITFGAIAILFIAVLVVRKLCHRRSYTPKEAYVAPDARRMYQVINID